MGSGNVAVGGGDGNCGRLRRRLTSPIRQQGADEHEKMNENR